MSNLSELLPAGGAAKEFEPVASGTLPNGQAVVLKSNGQVEAVGPVTTNPTEDIPSGTEVTFAVGARYIVVSFDPNTDNTFVMCYQEPNASYAALCVVGKISGTVISFGTPVVINSGTTTTQMGIQYDPNVAGKFVVAYLDNNANGRARIGTVVGTSITYGGQATFNSGNCAYISPSFDPNTAGKLVICYQDIGTSNKGTCIIGTYTGTSLSFGTKDGIGGQADYWIGTSCSYDPNTAGKFVVVGRNQSNSERGESRIGVVSGTSISWGDNTTFNSTAANNCEVRFDPSTAGKYVIAYTDENNSHYGTGIVGTYSGASNAIAYGSKYVWGSVNTNTGMVLSFDPNTTGKLAIGYTNLTSSNRPQVVLGTVSSSAISYGTTTVIKTTQGPQIALGFNPTESNAGQFVFAYRDDNNSSTGTAFTGQIAATQVGTNASSFVGITAEAITSGATGVVVPQGGVAASVANVAASMPFGAETVFNAGTTHYPNVAYDPNNANKFVAVYRDHANSSYGTAIVGTISGTSITFGSEVVFNAADTQYPTISFDPNTANKFIVTYGDAGNSNYGTAIVGTISGTSISFGSEVVYESAASHYHSSSFDPSTAGSFVVAYRSNTSGGSVRVGIVSGTSISFGTRVVINSNTVNYTKIAFDPSNAGKFVVVYQLPGASNTDYGKAIVGTVSGSSLSFGSETTFKAAATVTEHIAFDPNTANKFVILYGDVSNSTAGTAIVGTVSGSSLSFGSEVVFNSGNSNSAYISFDPNTSGKFLISYSDDGNSGFGTAQVGTLSGTSVSFSTSTVFNSGDIQYPSIAYDPNTANKFVIVYRDKGNASYATAIVGNLSSGLTIGSNYYVQADGTVSTVSTSPAVNIGKAISTTSLILKG